MKRARREIRRAVLPLFTVPEKWLAVNRVFFRRGLVLPDFLGIGAPQSGTTWLYENLRCHPGTFLPSRKELRYFDKHFHRSLRWRYAAQFRNGTGKVKGEITPSYGQLPLERMQFIRRLIPKVKLILILQNPIDRLWSTTRRAFTSAGKSLEDATEHQVLESFRNPRHRADIDYLSILDNWRRAFPEEQIFVGFFDEIETDPRNFLTKLFTFLEVSTKVDWSQFPYRQVINRNPPLPLPLVYRSHLEEIYQKDIETLFQRFGAPVASWRCAAPVQPQATRLAPI